MHALRPDVGGDLVELDVLLARRGERLRRRERNRLVRCLVSFEAVVHGGREVGGAVVRDDVHGLRDDAVGVHRLVEVNDVVGDHVRVEVVPQADDVVRERNLAVERRGEREVGARSEVVKQLQDRATLVRP